jgi:hypothetical protein
MLLLVNILNLYNNIRLCHLVVEFHTSARGTDHPPFSNFLFTNLISIKFLYFFIISSLFPYFNLFVSIFIQSYVNIKLHMSTLIIHKACNSAGLKIVPQLASSTFIAPYFYYVIQTRTCIHS